MIAALVLFVGTAAAEVQYEITADRDKVFVNTTLQLDCETNCPVNSWRLDWGIPEGAEIVSIRDSLGKIEDYTVSNDQVSIRTNQGPRRNSETVEIKMLLRRDADEIYSGLFKRSLSLPGFEGEKTSGFIQSPGLLSARTNYGFRMSFEGERMVFAGTGPVNLRIKSGEGYETRYFSFFGERANGTEIAYEVPIGMTGIVQEFERFPVAVMPDSIYEEKVNQWSAGEYVGGAIQIRSPGSIEDEFLPVLAHEVVHGLNDRVLNWDRTSSSYFDEGTSKYVEYLLKRKLYASGEIDSKPAELFGEEVEYRKGRYIYTVKPKGDREKLWNYYQDGSDFMKRWNAIESRPENRDFGYAYSELVIRNYVANMNGSLRQLYREIDPGREVDDPEVKWSIYSRELDMTPCKYDSRERFEQCLESVNSYDYPVYSAQPDRSNRTLELERLEVPNRTSETRPGISRISGEDTSFGEFVKGFIDYIISLFQGLAASL